jgi:uncharacterized lipoprotein YddW (UPF0748 family)
MRKYRLLIVLVLFIYSLKAELPSPKHEIRAVWLTTIYGLDWPQKPATTENGRKEQQQSLCKILDQLQEANFNMVFMQVRMRGDVIYPSVIEPASKTFSGKYGVLPGYDPLAFAIEECHKRGMECHAWMVTFPVGTDKIVKEQGSRSVVKKHPSLCKRFNGEWYLDPGVPGTDKYILSLVKELVNGYDLDGVHFDYIRYPEEAKKFPDKAAYRKSGNGLPLDEWRRSNINRMVSMIYDWVKEVKPWVQVSSSPLGKYNRIPKVPNAGWTAYESVFQDPRKWLEMGKHDMVVPMMYYKFDNFFPFVDNWVEISNGRMVVPGLGAYRMGKKEADWEKTDITDQIDYSRYYGGAGCSFFRCANVLDNTKGIYKELKDVYYKYPAQLPPLTWLSNSVPEAPAEVNVTRKQNELVLTWKPQYTGSDTLTYTVYYSLKGSIDTEASTSILATGLRSTSLTIPIDNETEKLYTFCVTSSSRYRIESKPSQETSYYLSSFEK